jgi:signal peptidase
VAGKLINYPKNLLFIVTLLVGVEAARAYLYHAWEKRDDQWAFVLTAFVFWAVTIPAAQWTAVDSVDRYQRIIGGRWLPALAISFMATWLVKIGGLGPSFGYRFALLAFDWFAPELPNLAWSGLLIVGIIGPGVGALLVRSIRADIVAEEAGAGAAGSEEAEDERHHWVGWSVTAALALLIVLFWSGLFGVDPVLVEGISMEPAYERGDIAIVRPHPDPEDLQVDDVITYQRGSLVVIHRIVSIEDTSDGLVITTKGDNVVRPDPPIGEDDIEGKVVFRLPMIGRFNLWLRDLF